MRRLHLLEIEDQPWCPAPIRDAGTDFLQFALRLGNNYGPVVPRLREALRRTGARRVVDLCSGGGGPWPRLVRDLDREEPRVEVVLTDRYPNLEALRRVRDESGGRLGFHPEPVDALRIPPELDGFRTLFTGFHHFRPEDARAILADAVRSRQGIAVFEATERTALSLAATALSPLMVLLATPFIRPFRWSRLLWTYLVPVVPPFVLFDGLVSCLRTYTPAELRELVAPFAGDGYTWEIGEERGAGPVPVTYLIGCPSAD
ncbi:MAG TPA: hypothetical protein VF263_13060 [Longimicrobiaceae bacterium]